MFPVQHILFFLILIFSNIAFGGECKFSSSANIISQSEHELHQIWVVEDNEVFVSNLMPESDSLLKYKTEIESKIPDTNPYALLNKEYNDFMNTNLPQMMAEGANMDLARTKKAGVLRSINCLEALLLNQQIGRGLSWDKPMEFSAFILKKVTYGKALLKVYYSTNDRPGGKVNSQVMDLIQNDISNSWLLFKHLHNHTFNTPASDTITLVGAPSPSLSDVALYQDINASFGLKSASVTNGFDTLDIDSSEFFIFHSR